MFNAKSSGLSSKTAEFLSSGVNKLPDKWKEVTKNNAEYSID